MTKEFERTVFLNSTEKFILLKIDVKIIKKGKITKLK